MTGQRWRVQDGGRRWAKAAPCGAWAEVVAVGSTPETWIGRGGRAPGVIQWWTRARTSAAVSKRLATTRLKVLVRGRAVAGHGTVTGYGRWDVESPR